MRHVVDRIAPGRARQRQAGEDRLDGFDSQGRLVFLVGGGKRECFQLVVGAA
jgi:hypothetical protein